MLQYANVLKSNRQDGYSQVFKEAVDAVRNSYHVNALGGAEDLYTDAQAFAKYVDKLTEGFNAEDAENLKALLENNRMQVLAEASLAGIPPITALNAPTIVKMWAKSGLKNVIPTQVVDKPVFSVLSNHPYMIKNGVKYELPFNRHDAFDQGQLKEQFKLTIEGSSNLTKVDFVGVTADGGATIKCDTDVVSLSSETATGDGGRIAQRLATNEIDYLEILSIDGKTVNQKMSLERKFFIDKPEIGTVFGQLVQEQPYAQDVKDGKYGQIRKLVLAGVGTKKLELRVGLSQATHERSTEISFEVKKRDFEIPTGEHFEVNLPIEFINDMYALYQIDSASTATETMSNVINQALEQEIHEFLSGACNRRDAAYIKTFNVYPSANFAIQPKDWIEEMKRVIDYLANRIKTDSYFYQGYFVIYGNPIDVALLPNVSWTFNSASDNVNGINANYSIGAMSGSNKYVVVSSDLVADGALYMIMVPTVDDYQTFKYYPYTFNVVNNYLNAQGKKTMPNLMMTKRHTYAEFMNLSAKIEIKNNNGVIGYQDAVIKHAQNEPSSSSL